MDMNEIILKQLCNKIKHKKRERCMENEVDLVLLIAKALQATLNHMISIDILNEFDHAWFKGNHEQ